MISTSQTIRCVYSESLFRKGDPKEEEVCVPGFREGTHVFHRKRLASRFTEIMCAIKKLPPSMLHSRNPQGVPWITARFGGGEYEGCTLDTVERLLSMGVALGIVRMTGSGETPCDMAYVTVDNDRLYRIEKLKPPPEQRPVITRWER